MSAAAAISLKGRMRRRDWWVIQLIVTALQVVTSAALMTGASGLYERPAYAGISVATFIELGVAILLQWPILISNVRRAHDRDRSGRLVMGIQALAFGLSFLAFPLTGEPDLTNPQAVMALAAMLVCSLYLLFGLGVPDGTPGPNRFGPSPKATSGR